MKVKIKKLHNDAIIPSYAKEWDAGMDLTAISKEIVDLSGYGYYAYKTGLAMEIPEGFVGLIFSRSSISKTGLILANAVGVIDPGYRGEIECRFKYIKDTNNYEVGDRVAQLLILPNTKIEFEEGELSETERGTGGFGHTGK